MAVNKEVVAQAEKRAVEDDVARPIGKLLHGLDPAQCARRVASTRPLDWVRIGGGWG